MIRNERQFRITRAQAQKFENAINDLVSASDNPGIHPILMKAQIDALKSQLGDLKAELEEYEALRTGQRHVLELDSFEDLPRALVQARIAAGLSQLDLAAKLGIKEQQVQRYEASDYQSASLARVGEVVKALGLRVRKEVFLPSGHFRMATLLHRLKHVGLERDFVLRRLLPEPPGILMGVEVDEEKSPELKLEAATSISRIYGWTPADLFGDRPLHVDTSPTAVARFKLPRSVKKARSSAYIVYAHYLAMLVLEATPSLTPKPIPTRPNELREEVLSKYGDITFANVLRYAWDLGVPVLALNDSGAFHGACWRVSGRNVIVLKQRTTSAARWLHDLLHELWHAGNEPEIEEHGVIEDSEIPSSQSQLRQEIAASEFAGDVMLAGRAEELAQLCVKEAENRVEWLKRVLPRVAKREGVGVDALANYVAFRLSLQHINWWGAASNLQSGRWETVCTPRDLLLERVDLTRLNDIDQNLLLRALEPMVLVFSGQIGSGKSRLSSGVAKALGWSYASFGDYVRRIAHCQGLDDTREILQELGEALVNKDAEDFCRSLLAHYNWRSGEPLVIDGLRHKEVADALRRLVTPLDIRIVLLEVDENIRRIRLGKRKQTGFERLETVEKHPTEVQVKTELPQIADLKLEGNKPIQDLVRDVVTWVHQGDGVYKQPISRGGVTNRG